MSGQSYRDLRIWQHAINLVKSVYRLVAKLPAVEKFALGDQLRRAAVSVPANIAEGQARRHRAEFIQHLYIALGSLAEVDTLIVVAVELSYLTGSDQAGVVREIDGLRRQVLSLIKALREGGSSKV